MSIAHIPLAPWTREFSGFENRLQIEHRRNSELIRTLPWKHDKPARSNHELFEHECISAANELLHLGENWDEDGALPISKETVDRALSCLMQHVSLSGCDRTILPLVGPCSHGSIDFYWENPIGRLLLNVPASPEERVTFSWIGADEQRTKGSFKADQVNYGVVAWLRTLSGK